jgi:hypothetical protein
MQIAAEVTVHAIAFVLQTVPIGTNVGLLRVLWVMVNGSFLQSRGGLFPALALNGFSDQEVRRSWAAARYGSWTVDELLETWGIYVARENQWSVRRYEGYRVLSIDLTGFWRPKLKNWVGKHYNSLARRALPAVVFGVMTLSGEIQGQRIPLLTRLVRSQPDLDKQAVRRHLLQEAYSQVGVDVVAVLDAEFGVDEVQEAGIRRYVLRSAVNTTARRNVLPVYKGVGRRPEYGEVIRPLGRKRKDNLIPASAPDHVSHFDYEGRRIRVEWWENLVSSTTKVDPNAQTYAIYVYHDPAYKQPLVLATGLNVKAPNTPYLIYRDRWPVEHPPLAAKQMIGLHRLFVFAPESCFRIPELGFLAGSILTHTAAMLPPIPTGFWDRTPKPTPGRLRRVLTKADFPNFAQLDPQLREKASVFAHLPKGVEAHRRQKQVA